jgi:hypothetical protein
LSHRIVGTVVPYTKVVARVRGPLLVAVAALVLLGVADQVHEFYVVLAHDPVPVWPQAVLAVLALAALSLYLGAASQGLLHRGPLHSEQGPRWLVYWAPAAIAIVPIAGAIAGIEAVIADTQTHARLFGYFMDAVAKVSNDPQIAADVTALPPDLLTAGGDASAMQYRLRVAEAALLAIALAVVAINVAKAPRPLVLLNEGMREWEPLWRRLLIVTAYLAVLLFAAQSLNAGATLPIDFTLLPIGLGPLFVLCLFLACVAAHLVAFTRFYEETRFPATAVLAIAAVAFSALNLNDNHRVRVIPQHKPPPSQASAEVRACQDSVCQIRDEFSKWWKERPESRKAAFHNRGQRYPVFIIAAQGGGIYAAHLAAITLARLYDRCPALQHHVFAVSSVSGGSLGAGLVTALLARRHETQSPEERREAESRCDYEIAGTGPGPIEGQARAFLGDDFLSPVGAAGLFPDFLARFLPVPVPQFDRARAFEASLEQSWARRIDSSFNPMREGFLRFRGRPGGAPMLILNTTEVDTGRQLFIGPALAEFRSLYQGYLSPYEDLPLSAAIGVSARFPIVMPPATFMPGQTTSFQHTDGGLFENSGIETALFLIEHLEATGRRRPSVPQSEGAQANPPDTDRPVFRVLALSESVPVIAPLKAEGLGELMSPARAMYRARVQRAFLAVARAKALGHWIIRVDHQISKLPLGWQLSNRTAELIAHQIGTPSQCLSLTSERYVRLTTAVEDRLAESEDALVSGLFNEVFAGLLGNRCVQCKLLRLVRGAEDDGGDHPCRSM